MSKYLQECMCTYSLSSLLFRRLPLVSDSTMISSPQCRSHQTRTRTDMAARRQIDVFRSIARYFSDVLYIVKVVHCFYQNRKSSRRLSDISRELLKCLQVDRSEFALSRRNVSETLSFQLLFALRLTRNYNIVIIILFLSCKYLVHNNI